MSTISLLLSRTTIAAAVLGGVVALSAHAAIAQDDERRSVLTIGVDACPGSAEAAAISVGYDDLVDGHTPQQVTEVLADESGELWRSTELHQVDGDYFNVHNFPATAAIPITSNSLFTYSLTIVYEDGVTQAHSVSLAIADHCDARWPTTTGPSTTAPPPTAPAISRFELGVGGGGTCWSPDKFIAFNYVDFADGHVNTESYLHLAAGGRVLDEFPGAIAEPGVDGETAEWQVPGPVFDVDDLEATTYTLTMWVKYEDGVVESHSVSYDVVAICGDDPATTRPSSSPTTTQPSGTLPQTGSSMTWGIAALGALASAAGGALLLGSRQRRTV
jgi:LPXTG-motif cell wall-anchored protein